MGPLPLAVLSALVACIIGCSGGKSPTQPATVALVFAAVSAGSQDHTCGVTTAGAAYCWGGNTLGELGDGARGPFPQTRPVAVLGGLTFATISAGLSHTCGVTTGGAAYCWGDNVLGQLGDGTMTPQTSPVAVLGGLTIATVSAGEYSTCGVTIGGAAYCWGYNSFGQLGDGDTIGRTSPVAVIGGLTFVTVSAGGGRGHTCGVTTGGAAYCWGNNYEGQLGCAYPCQGPSPQPVLGGLTFAAVNPSAGGDHTCGLTTGGAAYCWGAGKFGPPVAVGGGLTFAAVSAGAAHNCGVTTGGAAYCWGDNSNGQLGEGDTTSQTSPVAVLGGLTFTAVSAGSQNTCGVATGGAVYCWGRNDHGQLGDGTTIDRTRPVAVLGP